MVSGGERCLFNGNNKSENNGGDDNDSEHRQRARGRM